MSKIPEAQKAFSELLLSRTIIEDRFSMWTKILGDPDLCQNLVTLMNTFDKDIQNIFYERLACVMYDSDFMHDTSEFHPELLALNEKVITQEIVLKNPGIITDRVLNQVRQFWMTDYPIMCYIGLP